MCFWIQIERTWTPWEGEIIARGECGFADRVEWEGEQKDPVRIKDSRTPFGIDENNKIIQYVNWIEGASNQCEYFHNAETVIQYQYHQWGKVDQNYQRVQWKREVEEDS